MATRSSILAWRIPWTEKPDGLQYMWLQRIRHNWNILFSSVQSINRVWLFLCDSMDCSMVSCLTWHLNIIFGEMSSVMVWFCDPILQVFLLVCFILFFTFGEAIISLLYMLIWVTCNWYSSISSVSALKVSGWLNLNGFIQLSIKKLQRFFFFFSFKETLNLQLMFTFFLPLPRFNFIESCSDMTAHTSTRTGNTF